jgi:hypothetical protein
MTDFEGDHMAMVMAQCVVAKHLNIVLRQSGRKAHESRCR